MTAISVNYTTITDARVEADAPVIEELTTDLRNNIQHVLEWLGAGFTPEQNHNHDGINSKAIAPSVGVGSKMLEPCLHDPDLTNTWTSGGTTPTREDADLFVFDAIAGFTTAELGHKETFTGAWGAWRMIWRIAMNVEPTTLEIGLSASDTAITAPYALFSLGTTANKLKVRSRRAGGDGEVTQDDVGTMTYGSTAAHIHEFRIDWNAATTLDPKGRNDRAMQFYLDGVELHEFNFDTGAELFLGLANPCDVRPYIHIIMPSAADFVWVDSAQLVQNYDNMADMGSLPLPT